MALIRGINVGGRRAVRMDELRALFVALGHESVTTYLQSGNVVFRSGAGDARGLAAAVEQRIAEQLDLTVAVVMRTAGELAGVVAGNPFVAGPADPAHLHVTFLGDIPEPSAVRALDTVPAQPDQLAVVGRDVYLHCPGGYGRTKLTNTLLERKLGVTATTRNWRTVTKLAEAAAG